MATGGRSPSYSGNPNHRAPVGSRSATTEGEPERLPFGEEFWEEMDLLHHIDLQVEEALRGPKNVGAVFRDQRGRYWSKDPREKITGPWPNEETAGLAGEGRYARAWKLEEKLTSKMDEHGYLPGESPIGKVNTSGRRPTHASRDRNWRLRPLPDLTAAFLEKIT